MYTLIPQNEVKNLRSDYRKRALSVLFFGLALTIIIGAISLTPSFVNLYIEEKETTLKLDMLEKGRTERGIDQLENIAKESNELIQKIESNSNSPALSQLLERLIKSKDAQVKLNSFALNTLSTSTIEVVVRGVSGTRDSLVTFKKNLENDPSVTGVDLPVSDLAKSKNINFAIKINYTY